MVGEEGQSVLIVPDILKKHNSLYMLQSVSWRDEEQCLLKKLQMVERYVVKKVHGVTYAKKGWIQRILWSIKIFFKNKFAIIKLHVLSAKEKKCLYLLFFKIYWIHHDNCKCLISSQENLFSKFDSSVSNEHYVKSVLARSFSSPF